MSTFETKKVWHSKLKYVSPLIVKFGTGQIVQSQYGDEDIIYFEVRGDEKEYYYRIENRTIRDYLAQNVQSGAWYTLTAAGKAEEAELFLSPVNESELPPPAAPRPQSSKPSNKSSYTPTPQVSYSTGSLAGDMERCIEAAADMAGNKGMDEYLDPNNLAEFVEKLGVSMFIQWSRVNFSVPLTDDDAPAKEDEPEDDYVLDIKALVEQLPSTSGTSHDSKKLKTAIDKINENVSGGKVAPEEGKAMIAWLTDELTYQTASGTADEPEEDDGLPF